MRWMAPKDATETQRRLHVALRSVRLAEGHIPCETDPSLWTSNDQEDREAAAHRCQLCLVRAECSDASSSERIGCGAPGSDLLNRGGGRSQRFHRAATYWRDARARPPTPARSDPGDRRSRESHHGG